MHRPEYSQSDVSIGMNVTSDMLTRTLPRGIFAASEPSAIGAAQALRRRQGRPVKLIGFDATGEQLNAA